MKLALKLRSLKPESEPEPEPEPELKLITDGQQLGLCARLEARAWLSEQGFDLLQIAAIERIWTKEGVIFSLAQLQERGVVALRAELAAHWGPDLRLSASWLARDAEDEPSAEQLLLGIAEAEIVRLRAQLQHERSSGAAALSAAKQEIGRLEGEVWSVTRSADAFKARAEASAAAARAAAERQADAVAEAARVAAIEAARAAESEKQRLRMRLREYASEAEAAAFRRAEAEALAVREAASASAAAELLQIGPEQAALAKPVLVADDAAGDALRLAEAEAERLRGELLATKLNSSYNLVSMQVRVALAEKSYRAELLLARPAVHWWREELVRRRWLTTSI